MKYYSWMLALLCLAASPLNASTVKASHESDHALSWYRDTPGHDRDGKKQADKDREGDHDKRDKRTSRDPDERHDDDTRKKDNHAENTGNQEFHPGESFTIDTAGTYRVDFEDIGDETLLDNFTIHVTGANDTTPVTITWHGESFLFDATPGEYKISLWADEEDDFHLDDVELHVTALEPSPVPLPAAAWLFGSGLLGLGGLARRKEKHS